MRVPPVIDLQSGANHGSASPPPLLRQEMPENAKVPPLIKSPTCFDAPRVQPPPLPEEVLQKELVNGYLAGPLKLLENVRRNAWKSTCASLLSGTIFVLTSLFFLAVHPQGIRPETNPLGDGDIAIMALGCISLAACGWFAARAFKARRTFRSDYKKTVFSAAIRLLNPTFQYQPRGGIALERFRQSRMFLSRIDEYYSEDYVRGAQGATAFEFAEVRANYRVRHFLKEDDTYRSVFHGLYFIADFNKHFSTSALVLPKAGEQLSLMTGLLDKFGWERGKIVHLEDPEFEREFTVHAEDEVEVRYLLTPALMRRILELRHAQRRPVSLSFLNEKLHIALDSAVDLFEPDPNFSSYSISQIQVFLNQVRGVLSLIDLLNLNTRIWSKRRPIP